MQAENLRKLLLAISEDVRVLLVKLADRLHNMRTLGVMREDKRLRIAEETMDIYAPLAGRMGMQDTREELEELAFRYINPDAGVRLQIALLNFLKNRGLLQKIEEDLSEIFQKNGIKASVKSRQKKPWSVFRKMETKGLSFEQLSDIFGFRVMVESTQDCYRALGLIHTTGRWSQVGLKIIFRRPSKTIIARFIQRLSARRVSVSNCRSVPASWTRLQNSVWPPIRSTRIVVAPTIRIRFRLKPTLMLGCVRQLNSCPKAITRKSF